MIYFIFMGLLCHYTEHCTDMALSCNCYFCFIEDRGWAFLSTSVFLTSSGQSWWKSYLNWENFLTLTLWSSWPGLGTHKHNNTEALPLSQNHSTHQTDPHLIGLFRQINFSFAWCPWLVYVCACPRVYECLFAGETGWWVMRADGTQWIRHGGAGKDPAVGRAQAHLRVSAARLSIKSISLMGCEMEL